MDRARATLERRALLQQRVEASEASAAFAAKRPRTIVQGFTENCLCVRGVPLPWDFGHSRPRGLRPQGRTYVRTYVRSKHRGTPNELEAALDENLASRTSAAPRTPKVGPKARPWLPPTTVWLGPPPSSSDEEPEEPEAYDLAPRPSAAPHLQPYPEGMCLQCGCVHCICDVVPQDCHRRVSVPTFVSLVFLEGCESAASSDAEAPVRCQGPALASM